MAVQKSGMTTNPTKTVTGKKGASGGTRTGSGAAAGTAAGTSTGTDAGTGIGATTPAQLLVVDQSKVR